MIDTKDIPIVANFQANFRIVELVNAELEKLEKRIAELEAGKATTTVKTSGKTKSE